jgi:hypothetical protein
MPPEAPREVSHFYVMVHPFYSLGNDASPIADPKVRKSIRFLLGLWGNRVRVAARDPKGVMIWVTPNNAYWNDSPHYSRKAESERLFKRWFLKEYAGLLNHARRSLGNRLLVYRGSLSYTRYDPDRNIQGVLKKRGLTLPPNIRMIKGRAFGEFIDDCITSETNYLKDQLRLERDNRWQDPRYSLENADKLAKSVGGSSPAILGPNTRKRARRYAKMHGKRTYRLGR